MTRYWVIAPYDYRRRIEWESVWKYNLEEGVISIGWRELGDISQLKAEQIRSRIMRKSPDKSSGKATEHSNTLYAFYHKIRPGDIVFARRGRNVIAAVGVVEDSAQYDPSRMVHIFKAFGPGSVKFSYPHHLAINWRSNPRDVDFGREVFGLQTLQTVDGDKLNNIKASLAVHDSQQDDALECPALPEEVDGRDGFPEGTLQQVLVNKFERSPRARAACLAAHGFSCVVCEMNFEEAYGEVAKNFIHVHHLRPLASIKASYEVDPINDLRPVCPNCHAVIHMGGDVRTIEATRALLKKQRMLKK